MPPITMGSLIDLATYDSTYLIRNGNPDNNEGLYLLRYYGGRHQKSWITLIIRLRRYKVSFSAKLEELQYEPVFRNDRKVISGMT